jgi:hypothetical protein
MELLPDKVIGNEKFSRVMTPKISTTL